MTQPAYIIPANYYENAAVDDVQDILDDLDTLLAANGWTVDGAGGPYTTPADPWGRYFKLTFSRASATRLQVTMTDDNLRSPTQREMDITGTQEIRYYYGTRYLFIENANQSDCIHASLLSLNPDNETGHNKYCVFAASRSNAGSYDYNYCGCYAQVGSAGTYLTQAYYTGGTFRWNGAPFGSSTEENFFRHVSGARRWHSAWMVCTDDGTNLSYRGKLYNALVGHPSALPYGSEYTVPIDEATTATFKVVNFGYGSYPMRMAMRKS